jgi:hypothetical protein
MSAATTMQPLSDVFNGDTPHLIRCINALLALDEEERLVPNGIGGHARTLLSAAADRLAAPGVPQATPVERLSVDDLRLLYAIAALHRRNQSPDWTAAGKARAAQLAGITRALELEIRRRE